MVHADAEGHHAVVAILSKAGAANPLLDTRWKNIPSEKGKILDVPAISVNVKDLFPSQHGYYIYTVSYTTPLSTGGVTS